MAPPQTDIWLLTASTPNGQKISMQLEELGLKYETKKINIGENEQKEEWFLKINRKLWRDQQLNQSRALAIQNV
jgi:glutathione S-transferase